MDRADQIVSAVFSIWGKDDIIYNWDLFKDLIRKGKIGPEDVKIDLVVTLKADLSPIDELSDSLE